MSKGTREGPGPCVKNVCAPWRWHFFFASRTVVAPAAWRPGHPTRSSHNCSTFVQKFAPLPRSVLACETMLATRLGWHRPGDALGSGRGRGDRASK